MAFTDAERRFMANASGRVKHLEAAIKEESTLAERIDTLTTRLANIRANINTIEAAIQAGIDGLKAKQ